MALYEFFDSRMTTPTNYGWFHILFLFLVIGASVLFCVKFKKCSDLLLRRIIFVFWAVMVALEIYKQIIFGFGVDDGALVWDYAWYAFPFQFCSNPLYVFPFIVFLKDGRVRDAFIGFCAFFSFFAGVAVMLYPNDVFIETVGINIQTMIHHGSQVVIGVFLAVHERRKFSKLFYLSSLIVFAALSLIAIILNVAVYHVFEYVGIDETFNMFYISPYFDCTLPVLSSVYAVVPYPVFLVMYLLGFAIVGAVVALAQYGIMKLTDKIRSRGLKTDR